VGDTLGNIFKGAKPMTAGGAPTSVPGMVGAVPDGSTTPTANPLLSKILKSSAGGAGDAFGSSLSGHPPVAGGGMLPATPAMPVDPGFFAPQKFDRGGMSSPIYGGM
jgi:hypothetical protein